MKALNCSMELLERTLDCTQLDTLSLLHEALRALLPLPSHYGENFDALYDCLTELSHPVRLEVQNLSQSALGRAAGVLRRVLADAERNNPNFDVVFTETSQ